MLLPLQQKKGNKNLILWYNFSFGGNATREPMRYHAQLYRIPENGWFAWREKWLNPAIEWAKEGGFWPRICLHWPFGRGKPSPDPAAWEFDSWAKLGEDPIYSSYPKIRDEYIPMCQQLRSEGYQVSTYLKDIRRDVNFIALENKPDEYRIAFDKAMYPINHTGGFWIDALAGVGSSKYPPATTLHPAYINAKRWRGKVIVRGDIAGVETIPGSVGTHWFDWTSTTREGTFRERGLHINSPYKASVYPKWNSDLQAWTIVDDNMNIISMKSITGETVRLMFGYGTRDWGGDSSDPQIIINRMKNALSDGHTVGVLPRIPMDAGVKASDIIPPNAIQFTIPVNKRINSSVTINNTMNYIPIEFKADINLNIDMSVNSIIPR